MANRDLAMEKLKEGNVNAASDLFQVLTFLLPKKSCSFGQCNQIGLSTL